MTKNSKYTAASKSARTLALACAALATLPLHAQLTWSGSDLDDSNWSSGDNWAGIAPTAPFNNTLTFSGSTRTTNVNDITGLTLTGLTFNNSDWNVSGQAFTLNGNLTGAAGRSVTLSNNITVSGNRTFQTNNTAASTLTLSGSLSASGLTITKDGSGTSNNADTSDLVFNGSGQTVTIGTFIHRKGGVIFENGVSATFGATGSTLQLGNDATHNGIDPFFTIRDSATSLTVTGNIEIGRQANAARLNLESGTLTANTLLTGQSAASLAASGFYQTGGTANIGNLRPGNNGASTISVAGGTLNVAVTTASNSKLVEGGTSTMTVSGGNVNFTAATVSGSTITFTGATGGSAFNLATGAGTGTLNLTGGTLTVGGFTKSNTTGTTTINLDGGTLRAGASSATFLTALTNTTVNVGNGGAIIDTNGFDITVAAPLLDGGTGGLAKNGSGVLTLSGVNTFRGDTSISAGSLTLADTGALTFYLGNNTSNRVTGAGTANFDGSFRIDFTGASGTSWNLVNSSISASYTGFNGLVDVSGLQLFVDNGSGIWNSADYTFSQATGTLSIIPEPSSFAALAGLAGLGLVGLRRRKRA
jgi:autotransporter-associated beta strand protein